MDDKSRTGDLAKAIARAQELRPTLDKKTEQLNAAIKLGEGALASLKLGVPLVVVIDEDEDGLGGIQLRFDKWGNEWRLLRMRWREGDSDDYTPLLNASRDARIEAVEHLQELVERAEAAIAREISRVEKSTEAASKFVEAIMKVKS